MRRLGDPELNSVNADLQEYVHKLIFSGRLDATDPTAPALRILIIPQIHQICEIHQIWGIHQIWEIPPKLDFSAPECGA